MIKDLLNLHAEILRKRIADEMAARNKTSSGKTVNALTIESTNGGFKLIDTTGNFQFVEYGIAPTKNKTAKTSTTLAQIIKRWMFAKSINPQGNADSVAYAIATQLKRKGSKQYQSGKPAGILKAALNKEYMDRLTSEISKELTVRSWQ
jgi:hypothetical protein